jgi:hypothetical protein
MFKTTKEAEAIVHTLSSPSKMPGFSYNTPAYRCIKGTLLRKIPNSICFKCYAMKGRYIFDNVKAAMEKRFDSLQHPLWVDAMTFLINKKEKSGFFRWHDSGDLQGTWHLKKICQIAENLPHITFWLPTREYAIVSDYIEKEGNVIPPNLTIRLSALMIDGNYPDSIAKRLGLTVSGVSSNGDYTCPAPKQENECKDCRACWDKGCYSINYKQH